MNMRTNTPKGRPGFVGGILSIMVLAIMIAHVSSATAEVRVKGQHGTSKQPCWKVGKIDKKLSGACQRGEFRQRKYVTYSVGFIVKQGRGMTGFANKNWNLVDPKGLAKVGFTYHFYNQGYSNCKVFVARTPTR